MTLLADPETQTRPARISRGGDSAYRWESAERPADPRLKGMLHRIAGYTEWSAQPMLRLQPPVSFIPVIIAFGAPLRVAGGRYDLAGVGAFAAGLDVAAATTEGVGFQAGVQLDFTPLGAVRFLDMPLSEIAHTVVPFDDLMGAAGRELVQRLGEANDWDTRLDLAEDFARRRIASSAAPAPPAVAETLRRLRRSIGSAEVADMASDIGISRRHLTRQFQHWMGIAPSAFSRVLRFDRATEVIRRANGVVDWGHLAQDCGYFDQPHFNRDFRAFTGMTPGAYVARLQPSGGIVLSIG